MKIVACIFLVLAVGALYASDWPASSATNHAYLEVIISNKTSQDIDDTGVYMWPYAHTAGIVGAGVQAGYLFWEHPVTTNAIVRWRDAKRVKREQTVSLIGVYDPKVAGALTFNIGATNVTVDFKKIEHQ